MSFFENTRKPVGLGGKLMVVMMNLGHSPVARWGLQFLNAALDAKVLDCGCGGADADAVTVSGKKSNGTNWAMTDMTAAWKEALEKDLKEIKAGTANIVIKNGVCTQVAYSSANINSLGEIKPANFAATGNEDGVISGDIVGTNPKVTKDGATSSAAAGA